MDIYLLMAILSLIGLILIKTGIDVYFYFKYRERVGGSDALPSNGVLHGVRECNVSGADSDKEASVNGSLEKRTNAESKCQHDWRTPYGDGHRECAKCRNIELWDI